MFVAPDENGRHTRECHSRNVEAVSTFELNFMQNLGHTESHLWATVKHREPIRAASCADCPRVAAKFGRHAKGLPDCTRVVFRYLQGVAGDDLQLRVAQGCLLLPFSECSRCGHSDGRVGIVNPPHVVEDSKAINWTMSCDQTVEQ